MSEEIKAKKKRNLSDEKIDAKIAELLEMKKENAKEARKKAREEAKKIKAKNDAVIADGFREFCKLQYGNISEEEIIEKINHLLEKKKIEKA